MNDSSINYLAIGSFSAMLSIIAGAFASHMLQNMLAPPSVNAFRTGANYQFMHSLGFIVVHFSLQQAKSMWLLWSGRLMLLGTIIFCSSLYLLSITGIPLIGAITPIGGILLICAWACLGKHAISTHLVTTK